MYKREEKLDVVNEKNEVIGSAKRREIHSKGLWHRGVHVLVFNPEREVLLTIRSKKRQQFPNCYDVSVSEHVKESETYIEAAKRGLYEELSIQNVALVPLIEFKMEYSPGDNHFSEIFFCTYSGKIKIDKEEVDDAKFVDIEDVKTRLYTVHDKFSPWAFEIFRWFIGLPSRLEIVKTFKSKPKI